MSIDDSVEFINLRVIGYDWDYPEELEMFLKDFLKGIDLEKEKLEIKKSKGRGLVSSELLIWEISINKKRLAKIVWKNIVNKLDKSGIEWILKNLDKILDERGNLYLRFDKNMLTKRNILYPVFHGDVFHVKVSFSMYPKRRDVMLKNIRKYFEEKLEELNKKVQQV